MSENKITVKTKDGEMIVEVVDISPETAKELLELNTGNRTIRKHGYDVYADDMAKGNWKENGTTIVIGNDGKLKDGQHRLMGIVKSGVTLKNQILVFLPKEQANCYDIGLSRTVTDVMHFYGDAGEPHRRSNVIISAVTLSLKMKTKEKLVSKLDIVKKIEEHDEACKYVYKNLVTNSEPLIKKAGVTASVFNAYLNGYPMYKLNRFCEVLRSGITQAKEEIIIIKLRDYLIGLKGRGGRSQQADVYYRTQAALYAYEHDRILTKTYPSSKEYYGYPQN